MDLSKICLGVYDFKYYMRLKFLNMLGTAKE